MNRHPEQREGSLYSSDAATESRPHHQLSVQGRIGSLTLHFTAGFHAPWTTLFGPSGCGKSTLLRAMCGLTDHLRITFQRHPGENPDALDTTPPERRRIAYAPQHALLFPHLNVTQNIAFAESVRPRTPDSLVAEVLHLFQLDPLALRHPRHLSGGERQRVSLARALAVPGARLILLDEPFAGVDRALRDALLPRLQHWLAARNLPVISVTHDVDEPLLLQSEVIRIHEGRNSAQGPAHEVLADETARLLATLRTKKNSGR